MPCFIEVACEAIKWVLYLCVIMAKQKQDYSFWTKYKKFAGNEILLYLIMVVGIVLGIILFS
jgi:hypothetical protein